jgi:hypothetical protein
METPPSQRRSLFLPIGIQHLPGLWVYPHLGPFGSNSPRQNSYGYSPASDELITSIFLLLPLFDKQFEYSLSV